MGLVEFPVCAYGDDVFLGVFGVYLEALGGSGESDEFYSVEWVV